MKHNFIVIMVDGGVCSQLVKYTLGEFLKKAFGIQVKYDISWFNTCGMDCDGKNTRRLMINKIFPDIDFEIATDDEIRISKRHNHFVNNNPYKFCSKLLEQNPPVYVDGYYENNIYMDAVSDILLKNLDFSKLLVNENNKKVIEKIKSSKYSCAVHIRRGDFVKLGLAFLTPQYYANAIKFIQSKHPETNFFFFSNDIEYVRNEIIPLCDNIPYKIVDVNNNDTGYLDLYLISLCNAQIASNSSFGFWGAFLNQCENKICILPSQWLPNNDKIGVYATIAHYLPNAILFDKDGNMISVNEACKELQSDIKDIYNNNNNYLIETNKNKKSKICAIYFSSNGIFYPKTDEIFKKTIIQKNRYEWYKTRYKNASKHIFIRDINMIWYQYGISKKINTIDKLLTYLKRETDGYDIICIGSSAGGYAAILFGILLDARKCFVSSPCFNVKETILLNQKYISNSEYNAMKYQYYINNVGKYNDISELIKHTTCKIYYIFPEYSNIDKQKYETVKNIQNVRILKYASDINGQPFSNALIRILLNLPESVLDRLYSHSYKSEIEIVAKIPCQYWLIYTLKVLNPRNRLRRYFYISMWYKIFKTMFKIYKKHNFYKNLGAI